MILNKLQEALAEVERQREALNEVETQLRSMINRLSGTPEPLTYVSRNGFTIGPRGGIIASGHDTGRDVGRDRIDEMIDILRAEGKPLHITALAERLSASSGSQVDRRQIEPGLNRHVANAKKKRIDKFGPSIFGLPEWKGNASPQENLIDSVA